MTYKNADGTTMTAIVIAERQRKANRANGTRKAQRTKSDNTTLQIPTGRMNVESYIRAFEWENNLRTGDYGATLSKMCAHPYYVERETVVEIAAITT